MISFLLCLLALVAGYLFYGRFVEHVFAPSARVTPALKMTDGVDFVPMPTWRVFMVQFLNIAGTGPIFGALLGAKFGPACFLWIVLGSVFGGAVHDYLAGMISLRRGGMGLPDIIGRYLGTTARRGMLLFTVFLLIMVGAVFVYSPAEILAHMGGSFSFWTVVILCYYVVATLLPVDKVIGRVYPVFAFALIFMTLGLMVVLLLRWPTLPELWDGLSNRALAVSSNWKDAIFPCLFITVACGAISGFHATQSPLMARCLKNERAGRRVFYGAMITEGAVALVWAAVGSYFFYGVPETAAALIPATAETGFQTPPPAIAFHVCRDWLGLLGGLLALLGVVAAPITSGDTALRSARIIIADALGVEQHTLRRRLLISVPLFLVVFAVLMWQIENPDGFNVIWKYFGWANQTLATITLWALTVYLMARRRSCLIMLLPALFMTMVTVSFFCCSDVALGLPRAVSLAAGAAVTLLLFLLFLSLRRRLARHDARCGRH